MIQVGFFWLGHFRAKAHMAKEIDFDELNLYHLPQMAQLSFTGTPVGRQTLENIADLVFLARRD